MPENHTGYDESRKNFINTFNEIAKHKHRYDVFRDFVTVSAISLHNAVNKDGVLEEEYLKIIAGYGKEDAVALSRLLSDLVMMLEVEPRDVLGGLYMDLELGNKNTGQFFTPPSVSELMAQITYGEELKQIDKPFITMSDPACGAGGMALAFVKVMLSHGHNPAFKLWVQCIDIDRLAALMCYVQLSLWNIPAQVVVGNSLSMEVREVYYTPAHYMWGWELRLAAQQAERLVEEAGDSVKGDTAEIDKLKPLDESVKSLSDGADIQLGFDF